MRLSWPKKNDTKRALCANDTTLLAVPITQGSTSRFFINTAFRDVELYHRLSPGTQASLPADSIIGSQTQPQLSIDYQYLVHYCTLETYLETNIQCSHMSSH